MEGIIMLVSPKLQQILDILPNPDDRGVLSDLNKEKIEAAIAQLHGGGREMVLGLIDLLVEPGKGDDIKPHYALHCLAVHVCKLKDERARAEFSQTLASQVGGQRPKAVQVYLIEQLQVCARGEVVEALGKCLLDEELAEPAARALVAIGEGAADQLRAALAKAPDRCRLDIVHALAALADPPSAELLKKALGDANREIRLAAASGLARLGDAGSVELLLKSADAESWERIPMTDACFTLAENLAAAGKKAEARRIYEHLKKTRTDASERYLCQAAERALAEIQ